MKKVFCFLGIVSIIAIFLSGSFSVKDQCIRIHVRANSNSSVDQSVKYTVKDEIVEYLTPYVSDTFTFSEAMSVVESRLDSIKKVADGVLKRHGFTYSSRVRLTQENFPARVYNGYTLSEGIYDALIIELGSGVGDNWWCVLFPPLCFSPVGKGETIEYKSKLVELCDKIFG